MLTFLFGSEAPIGHDQRTPVAGSAAEAGPTTRDGQAHTRTLPRHTTTPCRRCPRGATTTRCPAWRAVASAAAAMGRCHRRWRLPWRCRSPQHRRRAEVIRSSWPKLRSSCSSSSSDFRPSWDSPTWTTVRSCGSWASCAPSSNRPLRFWYVHSLKTVELTRHGLTAVCYAICRRSPANRFPWPPRRRRASPRPTWCRTCRASDKASRPARPFSRSSRARSPPSFHPPPPSRRRLRSPWAFPAQEPSPPLLLHMPRYR